MDEIAWRIVDRYVNAIEAHIVRGRLEAEGIPAIVGNEHLVTQNWLLSLATGGVVLRVPAEMLDEARDVIASIDHGEFAEPGDACPRCGAPLGLPSHSLTREVALVSATLLSFPLPFRGPEYVCPACAK
ncbi:DUF2007 domain-containing protein [Arenimonas sp.]|uniref:putative signal transducing protein n=1 Tax=Arenimonas sp. TaxID=1872635 RepID=UPI0039E46227